MSKFAKKLALFVLWLVLLPVLGIWARKCPSVIGFPITWASLVGWYGRKLWEKI